MFGVALGIPGLVIGTLVGFNSVSHRWTSVPLGAVNATPGLQVGRSGARLGVALSLSP
jgi:hypothetical protein